MVHLFGHNRAHVFRQGTLCASFTPSVDCISARTCYKAAKLNIRVFLLTAAKTVQAHQVDATYRCFDNTAAQLRLYFILNRFVGHYGKLAVIRWYWQETDWSPRRMNRAISWRSQYYCGRQAPTRRKSYCHDGMPGAVLCP